MNDARREPPRVRPDVALSAKMSTLARRDTKPEVELRRSLHRRGLRFRVQRGSWEPSSDYRHRLHPGSCRRLRRRLLLARLPRTPCPSSDQFPTGGSGRSN